MTYGLSGPVLVSGAAGLVGRAVCAELTKRGYSVLPVVRQKNTAAPATSIACDLANTPLVKQSLRAPPSVIVHLAAAVPHNERYPDTEASADLTRLIDRSVLEAASAWQCPVVYMSTCGLYARTSPVWKVEDDTSSLSIDTPYFAAKYEGENLFAGVSATILRLAAPVGPGIQPGLVLSRFIRAARLGLSIEVWGSGNREQDFIDARDVAALVAQAVERPRVGTFNVASSVPVTMIELANMVVGTVRNGRVLKVDRPDPKDNETARYSTAKAVAAFEWSPRYGLDESIRRVAAELSTEIPCV